MFRELGRSERGILFFALALSAARLAIAPFFELFPQEAYYDLYARHLALSYFDHPPLIAWALRGFETLFGHHAFVLRLCAFTLTAITQLLFVQLVREVVPAERRSAALLWLVLPAVSLVSVIASPDVPLLLFWTAALLWIWRALNGRASGWLWAGLCIGLAFDGKYTAAYLPIGVALVLSRAAHRRHWRSWQLWFGAALGLAATAPVLLWNLSHDFASFKFQTLGRAATASGFLPQSFGALVATQALLVGPAIFVALGVGWWRGKPTSSFLAAFSLPPIAACALLSFFIRVHPNWLEPFYIAAVPLAALATPRPTPLIRWTLVWSLLVHLAAAIELLAAPVAIHSRDTFVGWSALARAVKPLRDPETFVFSTDGYKTSAELWFYGGERTYSGEIVGQPGLEFEYFDDPCPREPNALYVESASDHSPRLPEDVAGHFETAEPLPPIDVSARRFWVWRLRGYRRDVQVCRW